jgi:hypothetical protein
MQTSSQDNRKLRKAIRQLKQRCDDLQVPFSLKVDFNRCDFYSHISGAK